MPAVPAAGLAALPPNIWLRLDDRLRRVPVDRIRQMPDYGALRSVEYFPYPPLRSCQWCPDVTKR